MKFTRSTYRRAFFKHYAAAKKASPTRWYWHHRTYMLIFRRARREGITL